jgi:uncharacterized Zn finger protein
MEFTLKNYPCALCGKEETKLLLQKQGFSIVKCSHCGFVYVNPVLKTKNLFQYTSTIYFTIKTMAM